MTAREIVRERLGVAPESIDAFCRKWRIRELSLFGSALRDDFGAYSDVDLLVAFERDAPWDLWDITTIEQAPKLIGRSDRSLDFHGNLWRSRFIGYCVASGSGAHVQTTDPSHHDDRTIFRFGEFTFDCASRMLLHQREEQHLSPKAQTLLHLLLLRAPGAVSREELYDALWPSTFVCETNLATVISELRRVLGDDARSSRYIRTVHGFGYAFAGEVRASKARSIPVAMLLCEQERYLLYEGENTVGRAQDCKIVLTGATVSRHHAVILVHQREISIEDLSSRNGTYVNGRKIASSVVRQHDRIAFGAVQATIVRKISSTLPLPFNDTSRRTSSGQNTSA